MRRVRGFDIESPTFKTVMTAEPAVAIKSALTSAVSSLPLTENVFRRMLFHSTVDGGKGEPRSVGSMKPVPTTCSKNPELLAETELGKIDVIVGAPVS
jgi:hypothetical protein